MSVAYDVTGAGQSNASGTTSISFTVAASAGDYVLVGIDTAGAARTLSNVQFGGSAMTLIGTINHGGTASNGTLSVYGISGVSGSGTATATVSAVGAAVEAQGVAYSGVGSAASAASSSGLSSGISTGSVSCPSGGMLVAFMAAGSGTAPTMSTPTGGTNRYLNVAGDSALCINDATATTTFGVTTNFDYNGYVVVSLSPPAGTTVSPTTATVSITDGTPNVIIPGAPLSPASATVTISRGTPSVSLTNALSPATATVHVSGGTPLVANGNAFAPLIAQLAAGNSAIIECIGDSTVFGFDDGLAIGGWPTRIGLILGAEFNYNVTTQSSVNGTRTTQYPSTLGAGAPTVAVANFGVSGYTIAQVDGLATSGALTQTGASVVMIGAGFNDISPGNQTPSQIVTRMQTLVSDMQSRLPGVPIVITTQNPQSPDTNASATFSAVSTAFTGNALPLSPPLQQSTSSPGVWVLDSRQGFANVYNAALMTDSEHPNSAGYWQEAQFAVAQMPVGGVYTTPTTATIHITGGTPTLSGSTAVSPTTATITIAGGTPTLSLTANMSATPITATVAISGGTSILAIGGGVLLSPPSAVVALSLGMAHIAVTANYLAEPTVVGVVISGDTPVIAVTSTEVANPTSGAVVLTLGTPVVAVGASASAPPLSRTFVVPSPSRVFVVPIV